jgi:hypothetical protein
MSVRVQRQSDGRRPSGDTATATWHRRRHRGCALAADLPCAMPARRSPPRGRVSTQVLPQTPPPQQQLDGSVDDLRRRPSKAAHLKAAQFRQRQDLYIYRRPTGSISLWPCSVSTAGLVSLIRNTYTLLRGGARARIVSSLSSYYRWRSARALANANEAAGYSGWLRS